MRSRRSEWRFPSSTGPPFALTGHREVSRRPRRRDAEAGEPGWLDPKGQAEDPALGLAPPVSRRSVGRRGHAAVVKCAIGAALAEERPRQHRGQSSGDSVHPGAGGLSSAEQLATCANDMIPISMRRQARRAIGVRSAGWATASEIGACRSDCGRGAPPLKGKRRSRECSVCRDSLLGAEGEGFEPSSRP